MTALPLKMLPDNALRERIAGDDVLPLSTSAPLVLSALVGRLRLIWSVSAASTSKNQFRILYSKLGTIKRCQATKVGHCWIDEN